MRACVAPVCDFKSEVEVVTHNESFKPCWGNVNEDAFRKYKKNVRVEIVQVKGFMPPEDGLSWKTPTGRAVGKMSA